MTLRIPAKVLLHVWSYDFYDMTLSTGKQRRHMINTNKLINNDYYRCLFYYMTIVLWNWLPAEIVLLPDLDSFKREVIKSNHSMP